MFQSFSCVMKCSPSLVCFVLLVLFVCPASLWELNYLFKPSKWESQLRGRGWDSLKIHDPEGKGKWEGQTKTDEALKDICVSEVHRLPAHATIFLQTLLLDSRIADKVYHSTDPPAPDAATIDLIVQFLSPVCPAHKNVFTSKAFMSLAKGAVNRFSEKGLDTPWPLKADPDELTAVQDTQKWIVCDLLSLKIDKQHKVPYEQLVKIIGNMFFLYSESNTSADGQKVEDSDVVHQNKVKAWVIAVVMCRDNSMDLPPKSWFNSGSDGTGNFFWPPNCPCISIGVGITGFLGIGFLAYAYNWFGQNPTPPPPDPISPPSTTTIQVPTSLLSTTNIILTILFIMAISGGIYWWYYLRMSHSQIEESSPNSSSATKKTKTRGHKKKNKKRTGSSSYFASVVSSFYEPKRKNRKHKAKAKKKKQDSNFGSDISGMGSSSFISSSSVQSSVASSVASSAASSVISSPKPKKKSPKVNPKPNPKNLKRKIIDLSSALGHGNRKKMKKK